MTPRKIIAYKHYFADFLKSVNPGVAKKIAYVLDLLKNQERVSQKFVKYLDDDIFEIRAEYEGNIYRVFFVFDNGNIVVLFNGFQKKSQKTPKNEFEKAKSIKEEYYGSKS